MEQPVPTCDAPLEPRRKPCLALPAGACDAHFHVLGPWQRFPYAPDRAFTPHDVPKERVFALHAHLGITRGVVIQPSLYGTDHRALLNFLATTGGRYRGVASADGLPDGESIDTWHAAGVRGIRLTLSHQRPMPPLDPIRELADRIRPLGWHLDFHGDFATDCRLDRLLELGLPVVIDHMGRYVWQPEDPDGTDQMPFQALLAARRHDNCWIKISCADRISHDGAPFTDVLPYARALIDAAPDRVVWATDYPNTNHKNVPDCADLVDFIAEVAPDPKHREMLLVDNPARLYGFS